MNIPQLPTDNLYKFVAIFGLVIFVIGVIAPQVVYDRLVFHEHEITGGRSTVDWLMARVLSEDELFLERFLRGFERAQQQEGRGVLEEVEEQASSGVTRRHRPRPCRPMTQAG